MQELLNVLYEVRGHVAYVTVRRPKAMNALNAATIAELKLVFQDAAEQPEVKGIILTGDGERAFVAGADINELAQISAIEGERFTRSGQALMDFIETCGKPVVAAVNGVALGGGCELAMACTLRIAVKEAIFGQPEVKLGVIPGFGGTQRLPRLVGKGRALQLILTGDPIDAAEAWRIGLVNELVDREKLIGRAEAILSRIAANAPVATRLSMAAVNSGLNVSLQAGLVIESAYFAVCASSADKGEGTAAFLGKRPAAFTGH
jgi:enoyl-CoA hydratase